MTLSVLETSLPMQRSHDTLASSISAKKQVSWVVTVSSYIPKKLLVSLKITHDTFALGCEALIATSQQANLSSQVTSPFDHSANLTIGHSAHRSYATSQ